MSELPLSRPPAGPRLLWAVWRLVSTFLIIASTLLFVLSAIMWMRSYWVVDQMRWGAELKSRRMVRDVTVWSARGGVGVFIEDLAGITWNSGEFHYSNDRMMTYPYVPIPEFNQGWGVRGAGFTFFKRESMRSIRTQDGESITRIAYRHESLAVITPWWSLMAVAAPLPLIAAIRWRRRRAKWRQDHGLCEKCGYDLRATPEQCPECGHKPIRKT